MRSSHFRSIGGIFIALKISRAMTVGAWCVAILLALALAAPVRAQITIVVQEPPVPGFSNSYPWFNEVPQYQGDQSFQWFMANHPDIAGALARDPGLLYNANWRSEFPALEQYLANHPYEWQALNGEYWSEGPAETQWGDYDSEHQWRDAYWWHQNDPNWFYDNHQDWVSLDSRWLAEDGAYDPQHNWHYGEWWYNQNPNWVTSNHPAWLTEHPNWEQPAEQQNYRQQHATVQQNQPQRNLQPPQATSPQDQRSRQNQQNQQRAIDQRQASLRHQSTVRQENQQKQSAQREQAQAAHQEARRAAVQPSHDQRQVHERQSQPRQENADLRHDQKSAHRQAENGDRHTE